MSAHRTDIQVGSVWRSRDKRDNGRLVTIESVGSSVYGNDFVTVRSVRRSSLRVNTLLSRYDLVQRAKGQSS